MYGQYKYVRWTADYRLRYETQTKHYGLGVKHGLRYKMQTVD